MIQVTQSGDVECGAFEVGLCGVREVEAVVEGIELAKGATTGPAEGKVKA